MNKKLKLRTQLLTPAPLKHGPLKKPNIMVQTNKFRSLINLNIPEIKRIGQELLTSKPWTPPIGPNNTRYQGTPPKAAAKQSKTRTASTKHTITNMASLSSDISNFLNTLTK